MLNPLARLVACRLEATRPPPNACFVWRADPPASEWLILLVAKARQAMSGDCGLTPGMTRRWGLSDAPAALSLASRGDSILLQGSGNRKVLRVHNAIFGNRKGGGRPVIPSPERGDPRPVRVASLFRGRSRPLFGPIFLGSKGSDTPSRGAAASGSSLISRSREKVAPPRGRFLFGAPAFCKGGAGRRRQPHGALSWRQPPGNKRRSRRYGCGGPEKPRSDAPACLLGQGEVQLELGSSFFALCLIEGSLPCVASKLVSSMSGWWSLTSRLE